MQLVGFLPAAGKQDRSHISAVSAPAERLSVCGMQRPFRSKTPHLHITSAARVRPTQLRSSGGRALLALYGDSKQVAEIRRNKWLPCKKNFLAFAKNFCRIPHFIWIFSFGLCDVVPSVFLEGYTKSGFKSA